jgi:hypothetical protein
LTLLISLLTLVIKPSKSFKLRLSDLKLKMLDLKLTKTLIVLELKEKITLYLKKFLMLWKHTVKVKTSLLHKTLKTKSLKSSKMDTHLSSSMMILLLKNSSLTLRSLLPSQLCCPNS